MFSSKTLSSRQGAEFTTGNLGRASLTQREDLVRAPESTAVNADRTAAGRHRQRRGSHRGASRRAPLAQSTARHTARAAEHITVLESDAARETLRCGGRWSESDVPEGPIPMAGRRLLRESSPRSPFTKRPPPSLRAISRAPGEIDDSARRISSQDERNERHANLQDAFLPAMIYCLCQRSRKRAHAVPHVGTHKPFSYDCVMD